MADSSPIIFNSAAQTPMKLDSTNYSTTNHTIPKLAQPNSLSAHILLKIGLIGIRFDKISPIRRVAMTGEDVEDILEQQRSGTFVNVFQPIETGFEISELQANVEGEILEEVAPLANEEMQATHDPPAYVPPAVPAIPGVGIHAATTALTAMVARAWSSGHATWKLAMGIAIGYAFGRYLGMIGGPRRKIDYRPTTNTYGVVSFIFNRADENIQRRSTFGLQVERFWSFFFRKK